MLFRTVVYNFFCLCSSSEGVKDGGITFEMDIGLDGKRKRRTKLPTTQKESFYEGVRRKTYCREEHREFLTKRLT